MKRQINFISHAEGMVIPKVHYGTLQGFLEVLDNVGTKSDLASIAMQQGLELDKLLPIIEAGEMLNLIHVKSGDVLLTEKGHLFIAASPRVRKKILHDMVLNLKAFKNFVDHMKKRGEQSIPREDLLRFLSNKNAAAQHNDDDSGQDVMITTTITTRDFDWFIEWGRQGLVLTYDANSEIIRLRSKP